MPYETKRGKGGGPVKIYTGYHPERDFALQALLQLGATVDGSDIEEINGREPTLGEVEKKVKRNKHGLVNGNPGDSETEPVTTYDSQTANLLRQVTHKRR